MLFLKQGVSFFWEIFSLFIHKLFKFRHIPLFSSMIKRGCQNIINKQHKLGTAAAVEKNFF